MQAHHDAAQVVTTAEEMASRRSPQNEDGPRAGGDDRARLEAHAGEIAYSPLFGRLFELTVDVIFGVIHPREVIAFLDEREDQPEAALFRPFIETLWRSKPEIWGER